METMIDQDEVDKFNEQKCQAEADKAHLTGINSSDLSFSSNSEAITKSKPKLSDTYKIEESSQQFVTLTQLTTFFETFTSFCYEVVRKRAYRPPNPFREKYYKCHVMYSISNNALYVKTNSGPFIKIQSLQLITDLFIDNLPYLQKFEPKDSRFAILQQINFLCAQQRHENEGYIILVLQLENGRSLKLITMAKTGKRIDRVFSIIQQNQFKVQVKDIQKFMSYSEEGEFQMLLGKLQHVMGADAVQQMTENAKEGEGEDQQSEGDDDDKEKSAKV